MSDGARETRRWLSSALAKPAGTCNLHHEELDMAHQRADDTGGAGTAEAEAAEPSAEGDAATRRDDVDTGSGVLLARLAMLSLLPTTLTSIAVLCFVFFSRTPDGGFAATPVLATGLVAILAIGIGLQSIWVARATRGIVGSVERLVRALDEADASALESLHRRPDWEIALLYSGRGRKQTRSTARSSTRTGRSKRPRDSSIGSPRRRRRATQAV
jgi:hypothetical protein